MAYYKYFMILFLIPVFSFSQSEVKDLNEFSYAELKEFFWKNENKIDKQLLYAYAYLKKAKSESEPVESARGYYLLSLLSENKKALTYLDSAIFYTKDLTDPKFPAYAYSEKGYIYKRQFKYNEAINNFLIAEKIAKKNNLDLFYEIKFNIAALRSEELGEVIEALTLYKECFRYYKSKKVKSPDYNESYQLAVFALADAYKTLKISDSASYYNRLGYYESKTTKSNLSNALFTLNEGANQAFEKNFNIALDSIKIAIPKIIFYKDKGNILAAYYYSAIAFDGLHKKKEAVRNFIRVDSMYNITKRITPEFISGYPYLISYFKNKNDKVNQLKYLTKYMYINSVLQNNYKELTKKLQIEYDIPILIQEKENLIKSLKNDNVKSNFNIGLLSLIVLIMAGFSLYQYRLKKIYVSRFAQVVQDLDNDKKENKTQKNMEFVKPNDSKKDSIGINDELISQILNKLDDFEIKKTFLQSNLTIQSLSDAFETNTKYVSKIVNVYKEKTFTQYINDLRIEHALISLKVDSKLRKYTIQALAEEFGFNNAESFSSAFQKKTGLKPTYFIKKIGA